MRDFRDKEFALNISVKRAIKEHGVIAEGAIRAELQQMVDEQVWTLVKLDQIPPNKRGKIIRSKMFCKAKFNADGTFDKLLKVPSALNFALQNIFDLMILPLLLGGI
jgi:hypothetical protein